MSKNNANIQIYGGDTDLVAYAAVGTTAPTGLTALVSTVHKDVGWLGDDGIDWDDAAEEATFRAFQGGVEVVRVVSSTDRSFKFRCLEESARTMGLRYPGFVPAAVSGQTGVYGGQVPTPTSVAYQWVVDLSSINNQVSGGAVRKRYVVPKGAVSGSGTVVARRDQMSILEFTVSVLEGTFFTYSNSPGWAPEA